MTRQSRMLVVIGGFGLLAVVVLGSLAKRYEQLLAPEDAAAAPGWRGDRFQQERVDGFVAVRSELRRALDESAADADEATLARLRETRDAALARIGMKPRAYLEVRSDWRRWRRDPSRVPANTAAAFERRREELETLDLGAYESTDL